MKTTGIFFGSSTGMTENIAHIVADKLGIAASDVHNVANASPSEAARYDVLLLGSSTWGSGDLQDDWYDFLQELKKTDLAGKLVGLFGCGDSASFGDTFCNALGTIHQELQQTGCRFIGAIPTDGYSFDDSTAIVEGQFVGCPLDEMNEDDQTEARLDAWIAQLRADGMEG